MVWPRLFVGAHAERRVFLGQAAQGDAHLFLVGLGLGLHRLADHRLGEDHPFQRDDGVRVAQGFARGHVLQAHAGGDVAGQDLLDLLALVGVHLQDAADALLLAADRVVDRVARLQHAGIHAHESQLADVGVGHQLEGQRGELLVVGGTAHDWLVVVVRARHRRDVDRRGHEVDHAVEHALHALVLEGRAAEHRLDLGGDGARAQAQLDLVLGQLAGLEVLVHQLFAGFGGGLDHVLAPLLRLGQQVGRNVAEVELHALRSLVPDDGLHLDQVDHAGEVFFGADRHHDRHRVRLQAHLHLLVRPCRSSRRCGPSC